jgi:hypothetical protein
MKVEQMMARLLAEIRTNREKMDVNQAEMKANQAEMQARVEAKTEVILQKIKELRPARKGREKK